MPIKPIETRAYGHRFRSRLEARWAVFFETLGVQWEYEPEGFDLDGEFYLPDFRVTTGDLVYWYEIKPPGTDSCPKFERFADMLIYSHEREHGYAPMNLEVRLVHGDPFAVFGDGRSVCPRCGGYLEPSDIQAPFNRHEEWEYLCFPCDSSTPGGGGHPYEYGFAGNLCRPHKGSILATIDQHQDLVNKLHNACAAARSARFEHGETPTFSI
jgi:hypothetical protein